MVVFWVCLIAAGFLVALYVFTGAPVAETPRATFYVIDVGGLAFVGYEAMLGVCLTLGLAAAFALQTPIDEENTRIAAAITDYQLNLRAGQSDPAPIDRSARAMVEALTDTTLFARDPALVEKLAEYAPVIANDHVASRANLARAETLVLALIGAVLVASAIQLVFISRVLTGPQRSLPIMIIIMMAVLYLMSYDVSWRLTNDKGECDTCAIFGDKPND